MSYSVGVIWGIYIIVVVITFIVLLLLLDVARNYYRSVSYGTAFFMATVFGAIAVFIGTAWLDPNQLNDMDKTWLSVLFIVAFLLPIFVIFYVIWSGEYASIIGDCNKKCEIPCEKECETPCEKKKKDKCYIKKNIHCDSDTGICHVKKEKIYQGDNITTITYSSPRHRSFSETN
jgi:hypothetical protein